MRNNLVIRIHNVEEITAQEKWRLDCGVYVKDLLIKTSDGTYEITLIGDKASNLKIRNKGTYRE